MNRLFGWAVGWGCAMRVVLSIDYVKAFVCFEAAVVLISYSLVLDRQHTTLYIQHVDVFAQALFEI